MTFLRFISGASQEGQTIAPKTAEAYRIDGAKSPKVARVSGGSWQTTLTEHMYDLQCAASGPRTVRVVDHSGVRVRGHSYIPPAVGVGVGAELTLIPRSAQPLNLAVRPRHRLV